MNKLEKFYTAMIKHKKVDKDPYNRGRTTWCHLLVKHKDELHKLQVRGLSFTKEKDVLTVSIVNWTMCAGTATLTLTEENCGRYIIEEDEPTIGLLYVE